jgi:hypothetical protein
MRVLVPGLTLSFAEKLTNLTITAGVVYRLFLACLKIVFVPLYSIANGNRKNQKNNYINCN